MGKKRSYPSDSEASDDEGDQVMNNGNEDEVGSPSMLSPSPNTKQKDMHLRSGKRKRRRSKETTGLTPPATSKRAKKKLKIHADDDNDENGDKKPSAVTFEESKIAIEDDSSPLAADPRRISYSGTYAANNPSDEQSGNSEDEDEESDEIDVVPPKQVPIVATPKQTDSEEAIVQKPPPETDGETKDEIVNEIAIPADGVEPKSTAIPTWQRLVIHAVLGFLALLLSMPQVVKLTQTVVPLDDSILPPNRRLTTMNVSSPEEFSKKMETLQEATSEYSSSKTSFEGYFDELLGQIGSVAAQLEPKQKEMEERLENLKQLEKLLNGLGTEGNEKWEDASSLAEQVLGASLIPMSSIDLWEIQDETDEECDFGLDDDDDDEEQDETPLSTSLLEEKIASLALRSTITAEKFTGGAVAEERIRMEVQYHIDNMIDDDEDAMEAIQAIAPSTTAGPSDDQLSEIIAEYLDARRADITGIYDYASLKNGAEVIYGGKRGTSKSLIDELPVLNRILQNSNLRFYGFGPEAALTATYPPSALGQCWSFGQTSLKEQLKERKLFESDTTVKNDFKRGNFGTLTISLPQAISVHEIVIEHPPMRKSDSTISAIRKFRLVGYEDSMATSKAWNLGSFEYSQMENISHNRYLQTFATATTVFGKEIPPLQSISLAVDSNYGHEYSCLYRIRVHGDPK